MLRHVYRALPMGHFNVQMMEMERRQTFGCGGQLAAF